MAIGSHGPHQGTTPANGVPPKRGPSYGTESGSQKVKADSRPSLFVTPILFHKTAPILEPLSKFTWIKNHSDRVVAFRIPLFEMSCNVSILNKLVTCPGQNEDFGWNQDRNKNKPFVFWYMITWAWNNCKSWYWIVCNIETKLHMSRMGITNDQQ